MNRPGRRIGWLLGMAPALVCVGCWAFPSAHTGSRNYGLSEMPVDAPGDCGDADFEARLKGGQVFKLYCGACHNARPLGERPFANYEVAAAHMREQAYLTGQEYRQLMHFLRRWHDVGPPTPDVEPSPKRHVFAQPIAELRERAPDQKPPPPEKPAQP